MTTPYVTGTVSVTAGSAVVTGSGTGWDTSGLVAGILGVNGIAVPVASIDSDTQITLALEWPGASASGQEYWITYDTEPGQQTVANAQRLAEYIARLNNPALAAAAGVTPSANKVLLFTGTNTATLIDLEDLLQPIKFDSEVATLAGRAAYDTQPKGYRVLVANVGDGRSAFYTKLSNTSADWSVAFYISGTVGPAGVANARGTYAAGTAYAKNDLVLDNGSSWIAKVATTGNAPPTLPATSNTYWQLAAAKGSDGTGTGDVVGPNGGVTAKQIAGFGSTTGKAIVGLTPAEVRAAADAGILSGFRNKIINGNFAFWQRGTTQTATGYGSCDRWRNGHAGSTKTVSQLIIGPGSFAFEDRFYCRTVVSSVAGASNYVQLLQNIEDVRTLAGKKVTLTFWARTTGADKSIAIEFAQVFGTGGSPSANVLGIDVKKVTLSSTLGVNGFQKYSLTFDIPPITGKTIGANDDSSLAVVFWFDAGSDFNSRTASLGQQSGTFDIAHVSLVEGDATGESDPFSPRPPQQELALCYRYYFKGFLPLVGVVSSNASAITRIGASLFAPMRATPVSSITGQVYDGTVVSTITGVQQSYLTPTSIEYDLLISPNQNVGRASRFFTNAGNVITVDAEL